MDAPLSRDPAFALDDWLTPSLNAFARDLSSRSGDLLVAYEEFLSVVELDPQQRKALIAITLRAAAEICSQGRPLTGFSEQVLYNGRRLAKLNVTLDRLSALLSGLRSISRVSLEAEPAAERLHHQTLILLNRAFYEVREAETEVFYDLFWGQLESPSLQTLLEGFMHRLRRYCRADGAVLAFQSRENGNWECMAIAGAGNPDGPLRIENSSPLLQKLKVVQYVSNGDPAEILICNDWARRYRSCWSIPLAAYGRQYGVIQLGFEGEYEWLPRELDLLAAAAERLILAAEKEQLLEDLAAREREVRALAEHLGQVEEQERRRISRELHDEAGQSLLCLRLQLELMEKTAPPDADELKERLAAARQLSERTIQEIRRLIAALSPNVLEQYGLPAAVKQTLNHFRQHFAGGVSCSLAQMEPLPDQTQILLYRIVQECLTNIQKHSRAQHVNLHLHSADGVVELLVQDDGQGFDVGAAMGRRGCLGLQGIRERVSLHHGELDIKSSFGNGAEIRIRLPLPEQEMDSHEAAAPLAVEN